MSGVDNSIYDDLIRNIFFSYKVIEEEESFKNGIKILTRQKEELKEKETMIYNLKKDKYKECMERNNIIKERNKNTTQIIKKYDCDTYGNTYTIPVRENKELFINSMITKNYMIINDDKGIINVLIKIKDCDAKLKFLKKLTLNEDDAIASKQISMVEKNKSQKIPDELEGLEECEKITEYNITENSFFNLDEFKELFDVEFYISKKSMPKITLQDELTCIEPGKLDDTKFEISNEEKNSIYMDTLLSYITNCDDMFKLIFMLNKNLEVSNVNQVIKMKIMYLFLMEIYDNRGRRGYIEVVKKFLLEKSNDRNINLNGITLRNINEHMKTFLNRLTVVQQRSPKTAWTATRNNLSGGMIDFWKLY